MCEVMERYEKIAVRKANINKIQNMIKKGLVFLNLFTFEIM